MSAIPQTVIAELPSQVQMLEAIVCCDCPVGEPCPECQAEWDFVKPMGEA